jgi:membrane protein
MSLVPLLVATAFYLKQLAFIPSLQQRFTEFLSSYFLPETTQTITVYMDSVLDSSKTVGIIGILAALLISYLLLFTFSRTVNRIWRKGKRPTFLRTTVKYIILVLCVPVVIAVTAVLNRAFLVARLSVATGSGFFEYARLPQITSLLLHWFLLTLVLGLIPCDRVKFSYSLLTGAVIGSSWFFLRKGLDLYSKLFPQMGVLYGSLAFVPIFLIWVYLSWLIVLFGVELNYTFQEVLPRRSKPEGEAV